MLVQIHDLFDLQKIADSGQCFRVAVFPDHTYRFISRNQILYIRRISDKDYEVDCTAEEWENIWIQYFDLERDYRALWNTIPEGDCFLKCAARVGEGIRVLRQDPWETLISFILSQRKSIPAIRSSVELLSERYGTKVQTSREILHLFPTAWQMREASVEEYALCKTGYRAPYLYDAVHQVLQGGLDLQHISSLSDKELVSALEKVRGVGIKVANCVALFAYGRTACVPVDTWIKKNIQQKYGGENPFVQYGAGAGIMQQCFFYYAQSHKAETVLDRTG